MTDDSDFLLYGFWSSSATYRVRVALNIKGLSADEHFINVAAGEQRREDYLKVNPLGAVPAFFPGRQHPPLTQSLAILEFLEEVQPTPPLLPKDSYERARVRSIAAMLTSDTHPLITPRVRNYLAQSCGFDDAKVRIWLTHWLNTGLAAVESRLSSESQTGAFCHGESITVADICLASLIAVTRVLKIPVPDMPTIGRIMTNCNQQDAFVRADPWKQEGAPAA